MHYCWLLMAPLNVCSLNMNGFNHRVHIVMLQETHIFPESYPTCQNRSFSTWHHCTNPESKRKGVSIALHKSLQASLLAHKIDPGGRYLFIKLNIAVNIYTLANLYLPNEGQVAAGLTYLWWLEQFKEGQFIICGDFNTLFDPSSDTSTGR